MMESAAKKIADTTMKMKTIIVVIPTSLQDSQVTLLASGEPAA